MTQKMEVYEYMKEHGSITSMQAFRLGITRLASRIHELRKDGFNISSETIKRKNRYGRQIKFFKYRLEKAA